MDQANNPTDPSILLWLLAGAVALGMSHVALGWLRIVHRRPSLLGAWRALILIALTLGTGVWAAMLLSLAAQGLLFPLGFHLVGTALLWTAAVAGALLIAVWLGAARRSWMQLAGGLLLAVLAVGVQYGWVIAAGFRPGVIWQHKVLAGSAAFMVLGLAWAFWLGLSEPAEDGTRRWLRRAWAGIVMAGTLVLGQEAVLMAADLPGQKGSVYKNALPLTPLALGCGALAPLALSLASLHLALRTPQRKRDRPGGFNPTRRRKRRHRVREL